MGKIGYTRNPDGQTRVPPSTLVPGRPPSYWSTPPRPDSGRISNGSTRFWLLTPPSATRFRSHPSDSGRAIRPAAHTRTRTRTRRRVIASSRDAAGHFCCRRGRACGRTLTSLCSLYVMYVCRGCRCRCMHVHGLCTSCSTAVSHTPYICSSTTELIKSDSLHARR